MTFEPIAGARAKLNARVIGNTIDAVLAARFVPTMRLLGYRKSAHTWRRPAASVLHVVNIQSSMTNRASSGAFTMNLRIDVPELAYLFGDDPLDAPKEYDCVIRKRIGMLMPARVDLWWKIDDSTDVDALGQEGDDAFTSYGASWLEKRASLAGLLEHFEDGARGQLDAAAVALLCNDREAAQRALARALSTSPPSATLFQARCRNFAERNGLHM